MRKAVYPGTFDPVTLGHLDLIERGSRLFDSLVVLVARNPEKAPLFTVEERVAMIRELARGLPNVSVDHHAGMTVEYMKDRGCGVILRGLRTVSDFETEYQMALTNRTLAPGIETVFMMPNEKYSFISSRLIKEVLFMGGPVAGFVPEAVARALQGRVVRSS